MAKTLTLKKLAKEVKPRVGAGLKTPIVEKTLEYAFKEVVKALLEGKRVKIGELVLKADVSETPLIKEVRNPQTGEKVEKEIKPFIRFKVLPRKIEFSNAKEFKKIKETLIGSVSL